MSTPEISLLRQAGTTAVNTPDVSIITPVYNGMKYLGDTFRCLKDQTFGNFEWVIIDDCSTDGTGEFIRKMMKEDRRIAPVFMDKNSGPILARNRGMEAARGRFVAFLDADDLWMPEKLEKQIRFMKENSLALSYTSFRKIDIGGELLSRVTIPVPRKVTYNRLLGSNSIPASSAMFDRLITGNIFQDTSAPVSKDDYFFWLEIVKRYGFAMGLREDLFRLRIHNDSITGNKWEMAKRHWKMYREDFRFSRMKSARLYCVYSIKGLAKYLL